MNYLAVDLMTGQSIGRYETYTAAALATAQLPAVDIQYRPTKRKAKK